MNYREHKWGKTYEAVEEETGVDAKTLRNIKSISEAVEVSRRRDNLGFSHHAEVAPLTPKKQQEYLQHAVDNKWTVKELRENIKNDKHALLSKVELPKGKYNVIYVDSRL